MAKGVTQYKDMTGGRFGRLVVVSYSHTAKRGNVFWACRCDCGGEAVVSRGHLASGGTSSCGCLQRELAAMRATTHGRTVRGGMDGTYRSWAAMLSRCRAKSGRNYAYYAGRGIAVCERWQVFENFLGDMGDRPTGRSIDRIDNSKGYEPGNCRWATWSEQMRNRRRNPKQSEAA